MTIFDILKHLTIYKTPWDNLSEEDQKIVNPFILNRFISMKQEYLDIANNVQSNPFMMDPKTFYNFYFNILPKSNIYFKYIKGSSSKDDSLNDKIKLADLMEVSLRELEDYLQFISLEELLIDYGLTGNTEQTPSTPKRGRPKKRKDD